jgi:hypothetical protein
MADVVDPAVFEKLEEYFFCDAFTESFEAWAKPHAELFGPEASMESEQKLEHMQVYKVRGAARPRASSREAGGDC